MLKLYGYGRFTADPVVKYTTDKNVAVCEFTLAWNEKRKVNDQLVENVHFLEFVIWDKAAELVGRDFKKGSPIFIVSATPRLDRWEDKEGNKRQRVLFRVDEFSYVPRDKNRENATLEVNNE